MVITRLTGGLGNQMFQYAAGLRVAVVNGASLRLDLSSYQISPHRYQLHHFSISAEALPLRRSSWLSGAVGRSVVGRVGRRLAREIESLNPAGRMPVFRDRGGFDPDILSLPDGVCLDGYWQSELFFCDIADLVRREFTPKDEASGANLDMAEQIRKCESVSLHIRRGDYVSNTTYNQVHGTCPLSYYERSIEGLAQRVERPQFFVFSDDIDWARKNLHAGFPTVFVDINGPETDHEDIRLMSLCKHHIIANSTFSWWGAWLSNNPGKMVFTPARWFQTSALDSSDIVPAQWRRVA